VRDAAWASLAGSLYGGTIAVGFLLALGAGPFVLGLMAAIPFVAQAAQLPAIALIERFRQRRRIAVSAVTIARVLIVSLALLPFIASTTTALTAFVAAEIAITTLGSRGTAHRRHVSSIGGVLGNLIAFGRIVDRRLRRSRHRRRNRALPAVSEPSRGAH
jgi:hypothetical protein